jgi:hypothetical protein
MDKTLEQKILDYECNKLFFNILLGRLSPEEIQQEGVKLRAYSDRLDTIDRAPGTTV